MAGQRGLLIGIGVLLMAGNSLAFAAPSVHHDLTVKLVPAQHRLEVKDRISIPELQQSTVVAILHQALTLRGDDANVLGVEVIPADPKSDAKPVKPPETAPVKRYTIRLKPNITTFTLRYSGTIQHVLEPPTQEHTRGFSETLGSIDNDNVFLAATSQWYPQFLRNEKQGKQQNDNELITFQICVDLPQEWLSVTQGKRLESKIQAGRRLETWTEFQAQEEIYLLAAPFQAYYGSAGAIETQVFLRQSDAALAQKYLDATSTYLDMYQQLIGPYPYSKFALVENSWETGYGMPSFTLLGSKVIRFPFILHSSYPHEILHNWWGNGVYVDYESGNWAEGLTAYLADHLIKEQRGEAVDYRRSLLQKYRDYVGQSDDFPLTLFRSRHDPESEAIGYGKTAMVFHMLRLHLGDKRFRDGLRELYANYRFKLASFTDVEKAFAHSSETDLTEFFQQWVNRPGAPDLRVEQVAVRESETGFVLTLTLAQLQAGPPYRLNLPIYVWLAGQVLPFQEIVEMYQKQQSFRIDLNIDHLKTPWRVEVDPEFDVFRRLDNRELPAALSQGFGAERPLLVLPAQASTEMRQAYQELAVAWGETQLDAAEWVWDNSLAALPDQRTVWLFGWENSYRSRISQLDTGQRINTWPGQVEIGQERYQQAGHSVVVSGRNPNNPEQTILWLATANPKAVPGLSRKLPHYGKYSYLVFSGDEPENIAKGQWQISASPMAVDLQSPQPRPKTTVPRRQALVEPVVRSSSVGTLNTLQ